MAQWAPLFSRPLNSYLHGYNYFYPGWLEQWLGPTLRGYLPQIPSQGSIDPLLRPIKPAPVTPQPALKAPPGPIPDTNIEQHNMINNGNNLRQSQSTTVTCDNGRCVQTTIICDNGNCVQTIKKSNDTPNVQSDHNNGNGNVQSNSATVTQTGNGKGNGNGNNNNGDGCGVCGG